MNDIPRVEVQIRFSDTPTWLRGSFGFCRELLFMVRPELNMGPAEVIDLVIDELCTEISTGVRQCMKERLGIQQQQREEGGADSGIPTPPGETLREMIAERGWTLDEARRCVGWGAAGLLERVISGQMPIDPYMASDLELLFRGPEDVFWLERERLYREHLAKEKERLQKRAAEEKPRPHEPDVVSPPGETLRRTLAAIHGREAELAACIECSEALIHDILAGRAPITADIAERLEQALVVPAEVWPERERRYREYLARKQKPEGCRGNTR